MKAAGEETSGDRKERNDADLARLIDTSDRLSDPESGHTHPTTPTSASSSHAAHPNEHELSDNASFLQSTKDKAARILGIPSPSSPPNALSSSVSSSAAVQDNEALPEKLALLVSSFDKSDIAARVKAEIAGSRANGHGPTGGGGNEGAWSERGERGMLKGYKRASPWMQFKILSGRAFKNLYRFVLSLGFFASSLLHCIEADRLAFSSGQKSYAHGWALSHGCRRCSALCWAVPKHRH
jgi:hypothetical protein